LAVGALGFLLGRLAPGEEAPSGESVSSPLPVPTRLPLLPPGTERRNGSVVPLPTRVPGDFEPKSALIISATKLVRDQREVFREILGVAGAHAPILVFVQNEQDHLSATEVIESLPQTGYRMEVRMVPHETPWVRDFGPVFVRNADGSGLLVDLRYDAVRILDDRFPMLLAGILESPIAFAPLMLEGGNLLSNGDGIAVTSNTVVEIGRERGVVVDDIAHVLNVQMGFRHWVIVPRLPGERTGHVDMFLAFTAIDQAVVGAYDPARDAEVAAALDRTAESISRQKSNGRLIKVTRIPMPDPLGDYWRSYTNVCFINGLLLVPSFSDVDPVIEAEVMATYQRLLPDWKIQPVVCDEMTELRGFLRCMTLPIPRFVDPARLFDGFPP
jgi:agmatine deiminase